MLQRLKSLLRALRIGLARRIRRPGRGDPLFAEGTQVRLLQARRAVAVTAAAALLAWLVVAHPPLRTAGPGEIGVRTNRVTGSVVQWRDGSILVVPGLHEAQVFSLRDRVYRPAQIAQAAGSAPVQSVEGLSVGVDVAVRYALDATRIAQAARNLPPELDAEIGARARAAARMEPVARGGAGAGGSEGAAGLWEEPRCVAPRVCVEHAGLRARAAGG
ncbi:MAG TPA: SPFH domain-containing protein [Ramlibacter sp.]|uniref:SPFH domain-containing protein n=1 Tax=Ramlibacter sp. TaxID=1917967 RepID=UPI002D7FE893|nr:SPFH domain-containing protein [Ramlibacter sp.]HET8747416.1 SPFH domain-containing protein [Ramlibacter sp.]